MAELGIGVLRPDGEDGEDEEGSQFPPPFQAGLGDLRRTYGGVLQEMLLISKELIICR